MRVLVVTFSLCVFGIVSSNALPPTIWRTGETTDPSVAATASPHSHIPSLAHTITSAATGLSPFPIKPPSLSGLPKLPVEVPNVSQMPTMPINWESVQRLPSPVGIVSVDPSKLVSGIKGPQKFVPMAIASHFIKPIATFPLVVAGQAYDIPLHTWESIRNIVDAAVNLPAEEISAGQKAVDGLLSSF